MVGTSCCRLTTSLIIEKLLCLPTSTGTPKPAVFHIVTAPTTRSAATAPPSEPLSGVPGTMPASA